MYKILGTDGKEYGPVTAEQIRSWMAEGRVNLETLAQATGETEWKPLGQIPEFAAGPPGSAYGSGVSPREYVSGPAIGLIVTAILGLVLSGLGILLNAIGTIATTAYLQDYGVDSFSGAFGMGRGILGMGRGVLTLVMGVLILLGALKMQRLESYNWAMAASIIAMIPCVSPCCVLGIPMGIWALVVLSKPAVKSSFGRGA